MKVSFFLGAGASVPFGMPTTAQFLDKLRKSTNNEIFQKFLSVPEHQDIEHTLRAIENIIGIEKYGKALLKAANIIKTDPLDIFEAFLNDLRNTKNMITQQVHEHYSITDEKKQEIKKHYDVIFKEFSSNQINVFTTNYDQIIEKYGKSTNSIINDGFDSDPVRRGFIFSKKNFEKRRIENNRNINLHKLHGSLNWKKEEEEIIAKESEEYDTMESNNILIYPTLDPKDGLDANPFDTINEIFKNHAKNIDAFIVIGYSFRDTHINQTFVDFLNNPRKKMFVISPTASNDVKRLAKDNLKISNLERAWVYKNNIARTKIKGKVKSGDYIRGVFYYEPKVQIYNINYGIHVVRTFPLFKGIKQIISDDKYE